MSPRTPADGVDVGDGRVARRLRNRAAVLDAAYDLVEAGNAQPTFEDVAQASGVSLSSVYRYFASRDEMLQAAVERRVERFEELFRVPGLGEGPLDERLDVLVRQRLALWAAVGAAVPVVLRLAPSREALQPVVATRQRTLRRQLEKQLAPELTSIDEETRAVVVAAADTLCQFEGIEYLRRTQRMSEARVHATLVGALRILIDGALTSAKN